ncbi:MAG: right-handed parallel beta-helix repeat-containing protein [Planctomycetaceae bacterium]|nr:right-handed parallel beta-helix repeat-containing protein [Planctomycetaceae bacterium]
MIRSIECRGIQHWMHRLNQQGLPGRTALHSPTAILLLLMMTSVSAQENATGTGREVIDAGRFPSLQAAVDAVPATGGTVRIPPGNWFLDVPLHIHSTNTRIEGSGPATNLVNRNAAGEPAVLIAHRDRMQVKKDDRLWRANISDLRITGNPASGDGILAEYVEEIFLQGVTVTACGGDGIRLDHCYEDPRISDCLLTYNRKIGLNLIGCHDIVVSANHFEENQDALHCIDSFNLCMTGNNLDDHLDKGVVIENTYGSVVSGNMIEECNGTAITLDRDCYGITLSANVIAHNGAGIRLVDAHGCAVSANTFTIMKTDALYIGPDSGRITVTGNNFCNSFIGPQTVKRAVDDLAAAGLILDGTSHNVISGNVFSSLTTKAIELRNSPQATSITGNIIVDCESDVQADTVLPAPVP